MTDEQQKELIELLKSMDWKLWEILTVLKNTPPAPSTENTPVSSSVKSNPLEVFLKKK